MSKTLSMKEGTLLMGKSAVVAGIVGMVFRILLVHEVDATWASTIVQICVYVPTRTEIHRHSKTDSALA